MRYAEKIEELLIALVFGAMVVLNFGNIVSRFLPNASWSFTGELLIILFIWLIFLAAAIAYKRSEHLGMPLLIDKSPPQLRAVLLAFSGLMSVGLLIVAAFSGYEMVAQQVEFGQRTSVLELPEWVAGVSIPAAAILIIVRVVLATIHEVKQGRVVEGEVT